MLEYILFKYRERGRDRENNKYLSVLKEKGDVLYRYYVINDYTHFNNKKKITKSIIRYLTERSLISDRGYFSSDVDFVDFNLDRYFYDVGIVYRYEIM